MSNEQDMRQTRGLVSLLPFTYSRMFISNLSLIGFSFCIGFYFKDVILELAYTKYTISGNFAFSVGMCLYLLTSYHSFCLLLKTFLAPTN
jgi:NADH-ubiquinone oxidoreductase chain 5